MTFIEKLVAKAGKAAMDKAFAKGLMRCPNCGQKPATVPVDAETLLRCAACGMESLPGEWRPDPTGIRAVDPDQMPPGTRIRREKTMAGERVWHIPPSGKFGFFLFFGLFWTTVTAMLTFAFLFGSPAEGKEAQPWFIYPFFAVFWSIGLGILYVALRNKYARHQVTVTRDLVTLRREMFGRMKEKSLVTSQVGSVARVEFYQQNYQPVYGVEIRGRGGKLRFGTTLQEEEKAWLVADIKRAVFGESAVAVEVARTPEVIAAQRQSSFSFPLPAGPKHQWIMGVMFFLIGVAAVCFGFFNKVPDFPKTGGDEGVDWFKLVFDLAFSGAHQIPILVGLVFCGLGLVLVYISWPGSGRDKRLEGDELQVALRTYQHGRVIKEKTFPRAAVSDVRASDAGSVNGKAMKRIDMIVEGRAQSILRWAEGDAADVWAGDVRRALGK